MILIIALYAAFAASIVAGKVALSYSTPIFLTGIRMFLAGIMLLAYEYFHPHRPMKFHKEDIRYYIQLVLFGVLLTYIFRFWGLKYMPAFKMAFLFNLAPFLTSLYSYVLFKEKISKKQWIGLLIGLLGMIPILLQSAPEETNWGEFLYISWPEIAIIFAVACSSYNWIIMKKLVRDKAYSPMMVNGISQTAGGIIALAISLPIEGFAPITETGPFWGYLFFIILTSNIICHNLYGHLLRSYSATFLSFAGFATPLFAAFYESTFYHVNISWHFYVACIIVFAGLFLFYQDELNSKKIQAPIIEE